MWFDWSQKWYWSQKDYGYIYYVDEYDKQKNSILMRLDSFFFILDD